MYKNLNPQALDITCRQIELIELTLTYGFSSFTVDLQFVQNQVDAKGLDYATRLLQGAPVKCLGDELPVRWDADDAAFREDLQQLPKFLETAQALNIASFCATVQPASPQRPYHENFEFHCQRLGEVADALIAADIRLGLAFLAPHHFRDGKPQPFIGKADELLTLARMIGRANLGVICDVWHWALSGADENVVRGIDPQQVIEVRLAGVPEDIDLETIGEAQRLFPSLNETAENPRILSALSEIGYTGPVTPWVAPSQFPSRKREDLVRDAAKMVDDLMAAAGLDKFGRLTAAESSASSPS